LTNNVPVADDGGYWEWRDALLRHPEGRSRGGDPCVKCGAPVPANAHWIHRDRHVCGGRCNLNLGRQLNRQLKAGVEQPMPRPVPMQDPRSRPVPAHFPTLMPQGSPAVAGFRYDFDGFGPRHGDTLERDGEITAVQWLPAEELDVVPDYAPHGLIVFLHSSGSFAMTAASENGLALRMLVGMFGPDGSRQPLHDPFEVNGQMLRWVHEIIREVTLDGRDYEWEAQVCVPAESDHPGVLWSPAYQQRSDQRRRISSSTARHARRVRILDATAEKFDPLEIYERDGWICQLCSRPVDSSLQWPDLWCASLDHVLPLVARGQHSRGNTQLAHWLCNVRKGAQTTPVELNGVMPDPPG
jgi:hypothetical protein